MKLVEDPMLRNHKIISLAVLGSLLAIGCGSGEPAVLVGRLDPAALELAPAAAGAGKNTQLADGARRIKIRINDEWRDVSLGSDLSFGVRELPTGDVTISLSVTGIEGTITLTDVQPSETIELSISGSSGHLRIDIVRRERSSGDSQHVAPIDGQIVVSGHHQTVYFEPGIYTGPVTVSGHHITLVGAGDSCDSGLRSVIEGDVLISGHHIKVVNLDTLGRFQVAGKKVRVWSTCGHAGRDDDWSEDDGDDD
jgi:hypothetical protein